MPKRTIVMTLDDDFSEERLPGLCHTLDMIRGVAKVHVHQDSSQDAADRLREALYAFLAAFRPSEEGTERFAELYRLLRL